MRTYGPEKIRWGIIGCGNVTEHKSGPGFQLAQRSELVAVMRRQAGLAQDYALRHGVPRWYSHAQDLISDPEVDAVYVATPVGLHHEMALAVCAAGKPCYVEKPMARHTTECHAMLNAFDQKHLPLFVAYYRRALPRFLKARDMVVSGAMGDVHRVDYRYARSPDVLPLHSPLPWRLVAESAGGGLFLDLGSHTLDVLDFILGPLTFVRGEALRRGTQYDVEDGVTLEFSAGNGIVAGAAQWDFCASAYEDLITISGTKGVLSLSTFGNEPVRFQPMTGTLQEFDLPNPKPIQQPLIQMIVDALLGGSVAPSTGDSAIRTSRIMDEALEHFYKGRADAFWLRPETWGRLRR